MKVIFIISLISIVFISCNSNLQEENAALKMALQELADENAELIAVDYALEFEIEVFRAMLQEIDESVAAMDEKNKTVKALIDGDEQDVEDDILLHLEHLHQTQTNSKHKIAHLQKNIDELHKNESFDEDVILGLEYALDDATVQILEQDVMIDALNQVVVEEGIDIAILSVAYEQQAVLSSALYDVINTAYVVVGTKKELEEFGLVETAGGYNGLGRTKVIAADADDDIFVPISIEGTDVIPIQSKKARILTPHPESSYNLLGDKSVDALVISNKAAFWDKSSFLVVEVSEKE